MPHPKGKSRHVRLPHHRGSLPKPRRRTPPGAAPGTLAVDPEAPRSVVHVMAYGPEKVTERERVSVEDVRDFLGTCPVLWVNVSGLGDGDAINRIGEIFRLHPLALEDVINVHQRPKVEEYDDYLFIVARTATLGRRIETQQLSLFLGRDFVVSFEERSDSLLDPVRTRIREGKGRIRAAGPDFLAYALLDSAVDHCFPLLELCGERLESVEDDLIRGAGRDALQHIHAIRHDLLTLRRAMWPQRDAINSLLRDPTSLLRDETRVYLRDCYDHTVQAIDLIETYREIGSSLMEAYLSRISNQTNEVMKVLTIIATIFIPLSFIAGLYGMNFDAKASPWNMPELNWYWGYPFALGVMGVVAGGLLLFFRRKGWLGASGPR